MTMYKDVCIKTNYKLKTIIILFLMTIILVGGKTNAIEQKVIAITEIVNHPSLEQAKLGLLDELKSNGYIINKNLKVIEKNAQGNFATAVLIAKEFVSLRPDVIIPISTTSTQVVVNVAKDSNIPIVFSSVTDPVTAKIVNNISEPQLNITGAIDFPPLAKEISLIKELVPNIKTIGVLYNPGEINSVQVINLIKKEIGTDFKVLESTVSNTNQVNQALKQLIGKVDAVYIPSDNTIFSAMPTIVKLSRTSKLPVFTSDPDSVKLGVLACVGYTQYQVGKLAGKMVIQALNGKKFLKIESPEHAEVFINQTSALMMGTNIPKEMFNNKVNIVR